MGEITWDQFLTWYSFYHFVEPFGDERADLRVATLTALVGNLFGNTKKRGKPYKPVDFMPYTDSGKKKDRKPIRDKDTWDKFKGVFRRMFVGSAAS